MRQHVDLWHRDAWTREWEMCGRVDAAFAFANREVFNYLHLTEPHEDGGCLLYAPSPMKGERRTA